MYSFSYCSPASSVVGPPQADSASGEASANESASERSEGFMEWLLAGSLFPGGSSSETRQATEL